MALVKDCTLLWKEKKLLRIFHFYSIAAFNSWKMCHHHSEASCFWKLFLIFKALIQPLIESQVWNALKSLAMFTEASIYLGVNVHGFSSKRGWRDIGKQQVSLQSSSQPQSHCSPGSTTPLPHIDCCGSVNLNWIYLVTRLSRGIKQVYWICDEVPLDSQQTHDNAKWKFVSES